jgi:microcin C transport system substrate-binding protein
MSKGLSASRDAGRFPAGPTAPRPPSRDKQREKRLVLSRLDVPAACLAILLCLSAAPVAAQEPASPPATDPQSPQQRHHALSLMGEPRFKAGFDHFDWVNPDAPKGGTLRSFAEGSFDTLNAFSVKGDPAGGLGLIYDSLMANSPDEPSSEYCLICDWVSYPADYSSVTFGLNPKARFNDGSPITPEDVIFSLEAQKTANPRTAFYYKNVVKAEKTGDNEVTFTFEGKGNRELPQIVGQLTIIPKTWWEATGADGQKRDITKSSLEIPLGSAAQSPTSASRTTGPRTSRS